MEKGIFSASKGAIALVLLAGAMAESASAQGTADSSEIIVTGSRLRQEVVQDVPIAVSVLNSDQVDQLHTADIRGLTNTVPNLTISALPAGTGVSIISLRGFATSSANIEVEPGIAVYVDGVYQTTTQGSLTDFFDLERIEVLRGPQGTLLGKNASAGAILLTRSRPTGNLEAKARLEYGTYNLAQAQAVLNFPIIDGVLAGKVFGSWRHRGNWLTNVVFPGRDAGSESRQSVRGALLFTPTPDFTLYVTGDYDRSHSSQYLARVASRPGNTLCDTFGVCGINDPRRRIIRANFTDKPLIKQHSFTANADWSLGGAKLSSITGYRKFRGLNQSDVEQSEFTLLHAINQLFNVKQFSQELRLASEENGGFDLDGKLAWLVAGYYGRGRSDMLQPILTNLLRTQYQEYDRDSYALFGHADYSVTDQWTLSFGMRKSWDKVTHLYTLNTPGTVPGPFQPTQKANFDNLSFEAGTQYKLDPDKLVYFRFAEGYRGGGFVGLPSSNAAASQYDPETSRSYEVGLKTQWLDRRLTVNLTAFSTTFSDLQRSTTQIAPGGGSFVIVTDNIAKARTRGVEFESLLRMAEGFSLRANVGYLDTKYLNYTSLDSSGQPIDNRAQDFPYAPKWTVSVTPTYVIPISRGFLNDLTLEAKYDYRAKQNVNTGGLIIGRIPKYATLDLNASLTAGNDDAYKLSVWVQNVTKKNFMTYISNPGALTVNEYDNMGRLFGVAVDMKF